MTLPRAVDWRAGELYLLDQTRLPHEEVSLLCSTVTDVFTAIQNLSVRGAPAIGIAAAYGLLVDCAEKISLTELRKRRDYLLSARPTAVNLSWALTRMLDRASQLESGNSGLVRVTDLIEEAGRIYNEDKQACIAIGDFGCELIQDKQNLLTHCNAGSLAVSEYGTALAPIYRATEKGINLHVFVDETRPLLQGARLTCFELGKRGVAHTLISDNMAAHVMSLGKVDAVIVGADRVAANGDAANKIGTLNLGILCAHFDIPFYVACPTSTVDFDTESGADITIEYREDDEVQGFGGTQTSPIGTAVLNPAFDVTPAQLITALITERGVVFKPDRSQLAACLK